ncbi:hypothetical protein Tco_1012365, partial [Tanacetum coccineum]
CYKALLEKLDWENSKGGDYPFDLSKPLPLIKRGKHQRVPFEYFINNDLNIEDMVPNIWSPVKVAYDRYALWGISHLREQHKSFYAFTKHILAVTHLLVMRKHGYGYLEEIVIHLSNLSRDDVADFAIALRMFTRSLVIQRRVKDLQLRVESYQKQINITKPDTTRLDLRKRHPHYQEYRYDVLADEKMKQIGKEKSLFHDQGHQQAAKGKEDDEEFGEICWW